MPPAVVSWAAGAVSPAATADWDLVVRQEFREHLEFPERQALRVVHLACLGCLVCRDRLAERLGLQESLACQVCLECPAFLAFPVPQGCRVSPEYLGRCRRPRCLAGHLVGVLRCAPWPRNRARRARTSRVELRPGPLGHAFSRWSAAYDSPRVLNP
jgi:hypothetical protein